MYKLLKFFLSILRHALVMTCSLLLMFFLVIIIVSRVSTSRVSIKDNSVLRLNLYGNLKQRSYSLYDIGKESFDFLALYKVLRKACYDSRIRGVFLNFDGFRAGSGSIDEIRSALKAIQDKGKFIVAYGGNGYNGEEYYLASLADIIFVHQYCMSYLNGFSLKMIFYKDLLDKLGIHVEVFRTGRYKSFGEPYTCQGMSAENKKQLQQLLDEMYSYYLTRISDSLSLPIPMLRKHADQLTTILPSDLKDAGLVHNIGDFYDVERWIFDKMNISKDKEVNYVTCRDYMNANDTYKTSSDTYKTSSNKKIMVINVEGGLVEGGEELGETINGYGSVVSYIKKAHSDPKVSAVVLRINSPGGSALTSELIWKEINLTRAKKPVVASMANIAASGGYYIASACDMILANPNTVTGSIGVIGMFFDTSQFFQKHLYLHTDVVKTSESADLFSRPINYPANLMNFSRPMNDMEKKLIQRGVDQHYDLFLSRVSSGIKMDLETVRGFAGGRVFTGTTANKYRLINSIGGIEDAILEAARLANIDTYTVEYFPNNMDYLKSYFSKQAGNLMMQCAVKNFFPEMYAIQKHARMLLRSSGVQARLPWIMDNE